MSILQRKVEILNKHGNIMEGESGTVRIRAVSYTHLDVYKRQHNNHLIRAE